MAKPAKKPVAKAKVAKPAAKAKAAKPAAKPAKKPVARKPVAKPVAKKAVKSAVKKPVAKPAAKPGLVSKLKQALLGKGKPATKPVKAAKPAKPVKAAKPAKPATKKPAAKPIAKKVVAQPSAKPVAKPAAKPVAKPAAKSAVKPIAKPLVKPIAKPAVKSATPAPVSKPVATKPVAVKPAPQTLKPAPTPAPSPKPAANVRKATAVAAKVDKNPKKQQDPMQSARPFEKKKKPVRVDLPAGYKPSAKESYMNDLQVEYFRQKLGNWRAELVEESKQTIDNLRDEVRDVGDEAERATRETENSLELRTRDRYRKLISKIDDALRRIDEGEYGFCIDSGDDIGLDRLEARPTAERTVDAQERWEHRQRQIGE